MVEILFWTGSALFLAGLVSMVLFRRPKTDNETKESH